jgi:hypothetical protein
MMKHEVYSSIVHAIQKRRLKEPFTIADFKRSCPDFGNGTYRAFLYKHRKGNLGGNLELFVKCSPGKFRLLRPLKYGFL